MENFESIYIFCFFFYIYICRYIYMYVTLVVLGLLFSLRALSCCSTGWLLHLQSADSRTDWLSS